MKTTRFYTLLALLLMAGGVKLHAQNDNLKQPFEIAKEEGFGYRGLKKLIGMDSVYAGTFFESSYHDFLSILYSRVGRYNEIRR